MKVCVLSSGSKGNSTYVEFNNHKILIDVGINYKDLELRLNNININPKDIDTVLITHAHNDHIKGLGVFYNKVNAKIYMSPKTYSEIPDRIRGMIKEYTSLADKFMIDDLVVTSFMLSHDVECHGYLLEGNGKSLVYITDTGYLNQRYYNLLSNKDMYVFESNHDEEMNMRSKKPKQIRDRVISDYGHLSNKQASYALSKIVGNNTKYILLAHLSEDDNTEELALSTFNEYLNKVNKHIDYIKAANQYVISDYIEL